MATSERVTKRPQAAVVKINILVVDDDSTSLAIVSAMLKTWKYEVVTVKSPVDALSTLRVRRGIDLVVTDLHMPGMNGLELQKRIQLEFNLPVIIMSSDDKESVIMESLACGAVFYIVKPVKPDDLKNVWQYAVAARKGKSPAIMGQIGSKNMQEKGGSSSDGKLTYEDINSASSCVNEEKKSRKRKASRKSKEDLEDEHNHAPKKAKVVWTTSLHNRFLQAIKHIGLEKAVPKKILEFMNVPGLTRENVASHLQKYRIFLKRVAEKVGSAKGLTDRTLRSTFAVGHASLLFQTLQQAEYPNFTERRLSFHPGSGGTITTTTSTTAPSLSAVNASNHSFLHFPNNSINGASSSNSVPRLGYGQSSLLTNNQPLLFGGNTNNNALYQPNRGVSRTNFSANNNNGGVYSELLNGASPQLPMYQQQARQPRSADLFSSTVGSSSSFNFGASSSRAPYTNVNNSDLTPMSSGLTNNSNYAGLQLTGNGHRMGQMQLNNGVGSGSNYAGYGMRNGNICNDNSTVNVGVAPTSNGSAAFGYNAVQGGGSSSSSSGFVAANNVNSTMGFDTVNQQQAPSASLLPPVTPQQFGVANGGGAATDFSFDLPPSGDFDLSDILFDFSTFQFPFEQQLGTDPVMNNADVPSGSYQAALTPTLNQLLDIEIPSSLIEDNDDPWNDQSLNNLLPGGEDMATTDFGGSEYLLDDYCPNLNPTPNQQQGTGGAPSDNGAPSTTGNDQPPNDQNWLDQDFLESLLGNSPF